MSIFSNLLKAIKGEIPPPTILKENKEESKTKVETTAQSIFSDNDKLNFEKELNEWAGSDPNRKYIVIEILTQCHKKELTLGTTCSEIPPAIAHLSHLTCLTLKQSPSTFPREFGYLQKLKRLRLEQARSLNTFPLIFCELKNLEFLDINISEISSIPVAIGNLTKLEFLRITYAKIQECSFDIFSNALRDLILDGNSFEKVPDCFVKLSQRCVIHLNENHFSREYLEEWQGRSHSCIQLSVKDLEMRYGDWAHSDQRKRVLEEISNCYKRYTPHLQLEECDEIPPFIHHLTHISSLTIDSKGSLENLIPQLGKFVNLTYFAITSPTLSSLPKEICDLQKLETLSISCDNLSSLPEEIENLPNLKKLSVSGNSLADLPKSFENLKNLTGCFLKGPYEKFPLGVVKLSKLNGLSIRNSRITEIPEELCQLKELKLLDLSRNQISTIPSSFSNLTNLININFANNLISDLPSGMDQLKKITALNLDDNQFKKLPTSLFLMHRGLTVSFKNNLFSQKYLDEHGTNLETPREKKASIPLIVMSNRDNKVVK